MATVRPTDDQRTSGRVRPGRLRFQNKIFAMPVRERLIAKPPTARVDALVAAGLAANLRSQAC